MVAQTSGQLGWFLPSVLPHPRTGKVGQEDGFVFWAFLVGGVGERGIYMEPVLMRTEEYVRCPVLLLFALSHTESFISSLNPELSVFR